MALFQLINILSIETVMVDRT